MRIRRKFLGIAALGLALATGLMAWTAADQILRARQRDMASGVQILSRSLTQFIQQDVKERADQLASLAALEKSKGTEASPSKAFLDSSLSALALLKENESGAWAPQFNRLKPGVTAKWPNGFIESLLPQLPTAKVAGSEAVWTRIVDGAGQPLFVLLTAVQDPANSSAHLLALGIFSASALSSWVEPFKGLEGEGFVIEERGFALAFSEQQYLGAGLDNHPLVQEILQKREGEGSGAFANLSGRKLWGSYSRVPGSNLFVAVLRPLPTWGVSLWLMLAMALGGIAVGMVLIFGLSRAALDPFQAAYEFLHDSFVDLSQGRTIAYPPEELGFLAHLRDPVRRLQSLVSGEKLVEAPVAGEGDKLETIQQLGSGLSLAFKGPLAAILGHAQLARSKSDSDAVKEHYVVIEREARKAREIMDNLTRLAGTKEQEAQRMDLRDTVAAALAGARAELYAANVKVTKDLNVSTPISGRPAQVQTALEEILRNAAQAMSEAPNRELRVALTESSGSAILKIEDTGSGITAENQARIFDPFFTTKGGEHVGLGLSVVKGVLRSMGAQIKVESRPGQGSSFTLTFMLAGMAKRLSEEKASAPLHSIQGPQLGGKTALSGTDLESTPEAPGVDEITLVGEQVAMAAIAPKPTAKPTKPPPPVESAVREDTPTVPSETPTPTGVLNLAEAAEEADPITDAGVQTETPSITNLHDSVFPDELVLDLGSDELTPSLEKVKEADVMIRSPKVRSQK